MLALIPIALMALPVQAQKGQTILLRMIDAKTGRMIETTDFLVQINHKQDLHADWVSRDDATGEGKLTLPADATEILIRGKYDNSMEIYVNCDTEKERKATHSANVPDHWYPVADILAKGLVASDECKSREVGKHDYVAKPGEYVFFVRQLNWKENAYE